MLRNSRGRIVRVVFRSRCNGAAPADDTDGAYSLVEYDAAPHFEGPPPHIHTQTAEYIFVLEGNLSILFGSRKFTMGPGDGMLVPPGATQTFASEGDKRVRFLTLLSPGRFEGFLVEVADFAAMDQWPPNPEQLMDVLGRCEMVVPQG